MPKKRRADLTSGQAAKMCGVSVRTLLNWINKGLLPSYKLPGARGDHRICIDDLSKLMQENGMPLPPELESKTANIHVAKCLKNGILIVDDDVNMCRAIKRTLKGLNLNFHMAHNAFDAGRIYSEMLPKIITIDIHMPDMCGLDMIKNLNMQAPNTNIIVISGSEESFMRRAKEIGAYAVVSKPFNNQNLINIVSQAIQATE